MPLLQQLCFCDRNILMPFHDHCLKYLLLQSKNAAIQWQKNPPKNKTTKAALIHLYGFCKFTCDIEVIAVVAKGGAGVQTRVCQLHSLDLQLAIADVCVFSIHHCHMVFGPVNSMEGVFCRATQIQTIPKIECEQLCLRFYRD